MGKGLVGREGQKVTWECIFGYGTWRKLCGVISLPVASCGGATKICGFCMQMAGNALQSGGDTPAEVIAGDIHGWALPNDTTATRKGWRS